jgi:hypothetical protein
VDRGGTPAAGSSDLKFHDLGVEILMPCTSGNVFAIANDAQPAPAAEIH